MSVIALIVAAGRGVRMISDYDLPKQYLAIGNKTILRRSIDAFLNHKLIDNVLVVIHESDIDLYKDSIEGIEILPPVFGGATRQESVRFGLEALININPKKVLIHDAARPFVDSKIIAAVVKELDYCRAVIPVIPVEDTLKKCDNSKILWTVDRSDIFRSQTPQGFLYNEILHNHQMLKHLNFTDDCAINEHTNTPISTIIGSQNNFKITTDADYERAEALIISNSEKTEKEMRIGNGYDIHRFSNEKSDNGSISLGCVPIPYEFQIIAHSDGDVVSHAIVDSILGALNEGDIGTHFPPSDDKWKNANSAIFLQKTKSLLKLRGAKIINLDVTIITEMPKINPYRVMIATSIAEKLNIDSSVVSIKAKTKEGLDSVGNGCAIEVFASCLLCINVIYE